MGNAPATLVGGFKLDLTEWQTMDGDPWFKDGLRFTCTQCGDCCTGEPGYVWVNDEEIADLAKVCGESPKRFEEVYVRRAGRKRTLRETADGSCVLFRAGVGCTVYQHRPRQCRTWPFWDSNLESPEEWNDTVRKCPGAGEGRLFTVEEIVAQSKVIKV